MTMEEQGMRRKWEPHISKVSGALVKSTSWFQAKDVFDFQLYFPATYCLFFSLSFSYSLQSFYFWKSLFFLFLTSFMTSFSFPFLTPFTFLHHVFSLFTSSSLSLRNLHIQTLIQRTPAQERHSGSSDLAPTGHYCLANTTYPRNWI